MTDDTLPKPADQVSAGGTPAAPDNAGIIDALRSRGAAPQSALANLQQPPPGLMGMGLMLPPAPMPANLGIAAGSGMLAGLAGRQNNPYLEQHSQEQERARQYQQDMLRMQERQQAQREKQNEAVLKITDDLLASDNPEARQRGAQTKAALYKSIYGFDSQPENWIKRGQLTEGEQSRADALIAAGAAPADIVTVIPKLSTMPGWIENEAKVLKNPGVRRALGIKSQEALELEGLDESSKLKLSKQKVEAQDRVGRGVGTARDFLILGAKSVDELVDAAITNSIATGQPVPPDVIPYMKARQREQILKGYTGKMRAAMEATGGDPVKALEYLRQHDPKATASDVRFGHFRELEVLRDKERRGQPLTQFEKVQKRALEGYLAGKGGGGDETVTSTEKRVQIKPEDLPVLQGSVDEITSRLTSQRLLPNDKSPYVVIQGQNVPKTRILEREYERTHPGWKVSIQWNPTSGKFEVVDRVQTTSTTRTKGPVRSGPLNPQPAPADESDEEDN